MNENQHPLFTDDELFSHDDLHSSPDIQVFERRQTPAGSFDGYGQYSDCDDEGALSIQLEGAPGLSLEDGVDDMCTSFVEEVFEPPPTTLVGRLVFGVVTTCCVLALLGMALFHIWAHSQATRLGFTYSQVSKQNTRLKEERRLLNLQLAKLRNPMRLARIARQQLGMRLPDRGQVISEEQATQQLQAAKRVSRLGVGKGIRLARGRRTIR